MRCRSITSIKILRRQRILSHVVIVTHSRITPHLEDIALFLTQPPQNDSVEAETEETSIIVPHSNIPQCVVVLKDNRKQVPEPRDDATVTDSISTSRDLNERMHDRIDSVDSPQNENTEYENSKVMTLEVPPPSSRKDQPQEIAIASKEKQRRGWKGVRRQITHMLSSLFCCLVNPKTGDATTR